MKYWGGGGGGYVQGGIVLCKIGGGVYVRGGGVCPGGGVPVRGGELSGGWNVRDSLFWMTWSLVMWYAGRLR